MAKVKAHVVHDVATGRITAIARPAKGVKAVPVAGEGQAVLKTKVKEKKIAGLVSGGGRVDTAHGVVVGAKAGSKNKK
ncbi:hypothetical protein AB0C52_13810 [Streptomyces sp. NPDC048717]|uniref:hypothetical protein n=1 Tax=Streptomyces sp. NPDC048717 TaxID=3154928 RepID=UPI00343C7E18